MKIQIENLRAKMRGVDLNTYQTELALDEYYKLLDYVEELETSNQLLKDCCLREQEGRDWVMTAEPHELTAENVLEAFGMDKLGHRIQEPKNEQQ